MHLLPFLQNAALLIVVAIVGAGMIALFGTPLEGWGAFRGFWKAAAVFVALAVIAALPALLLG